MGIEKEVKDGLSKDLQKSIIDIIKSCEDEDKEIRKSMIRQWKKNEEFWHGVQYLFWSEQSDSWRSPMDVGWEQDNDDIQEQLGSFSDKVVDIFSAHGSAIISALASQIPALRFIPDDADDANDLITARTYSKIADLVQRHNKAKLVFLRALFFLSLQGLVASYRYKDADLKYGSYKVPVYGKKEVDKNTYICPNCGYESDEDWTNPQVTQNPEEVMPSAVSPTGNEDKQAGISEGLSAGLPSNPRQIQRPELSPEVNDFIAHNPIPVPCPQCSEVEQPKVKKTKEEVPTLLKNEDHPKQRVKIDIYGPLNFKVPYYARNQSEFSYFGLYLDQGKDIVKSIHPDFADEIEEEHLEDLSRFSRSGYVTEYDPEVEQRHLVTVKKYWLRPEAYYRELNPEKREKLLKKFPDGSKTILIGKKNIYIKTEAEKLDDRWHVGQAGLSTLIHSDPILRPLVQIQEMRNQLVNLIIETISHGIPSDWADPSVVDFDKYGRFEAVPGFIYKAKPAKPGEPLGNAFYTSPRSTLSREVAMFLKQLDTDAQFCVGSFPSIYGGPSEGKSRTFAEYAASRQMALQRLQITWTLVQEWWSGTIEGAVNLYKECVVEDERYVKFVDGNYINVWIRQSELQGKVGGVEPEASDSFPVSLGQIKEILLKLMEMNNDYINSVLYNPENSRIIQDAFALTTLKVPGEAQRVKQVGEISQLLVAEPLGPAQSSVPIDIDVDDHAIHIDTVVAYLVDTVGIEEKRVNPAGYANCIAHLKEHQAAQLLKTLQQGGGGTPAGVPPKTNEGMAEE